MKKFKYTILILIIALLGILTVIFVKTRDNTESITGIDNTSAESPRIPKLEAGVNVHDLENEIFSVLGPESVFITTDRSSGSGIVWQYDGKEMLILTTNHLMQNFESGELELWTGERVTFSKEDVYAFEDEDVAVIKVNCKKKLKLAKGGAATHLLEEVPEIGASLWVIDSVYGAASGISTCSVASGEVFLEDYKTEMLLLYGEGKNGMSGSPVYDVNGRLIAMISGMSEDGTTLAAVPVRNIFKYLENN